MSESKESKAIRELTLAVSSLVGAQRRSGEETARIQLEMVEGYVMKALEALDADQAMEPARPMKPLDPSAAALAAAVAAKDPDTVGEGDGSASAPA